MRILIVTGIYPPEIGGPAEYAKNLNDVWAGQGNNVSVKIFGRFQKIPWGLRHVIFFFYILPTVSRADYIVTLDAFSAGVVTAASILFSKKVVFRTGGDVLWELYTERTGDLVLLKDFYVTRMDMLSRKERLIFYLMRWTLNNLSAIIWSTEWQRDIFIKPYKLENQKHFIVENFYGPKIQSFESKRKNFIASTRKLKWKNLDLLKRVFNRKDVLDAGAVLDTFPKEHSEFIKVLSYSYAAIIVSLGDISPNTIIDSITCNKPFILTKETGLTPRIKDITIFVDPQNEDEIAKEVIWLCDNSNYQEQKKKVESFNFIHTWEDIAGEYINIYKKIK